MSLLILQILQISNDLQKLNLAHDLILIVSVCSLVIVHEAFVIFCYVTIIISSQ